MDGLDGDLGFLLSRVSGIVVRATNAELADAGLRVRQYSVLVLACGTPEGRSQRELAQELGLDPSQVVALVDELAAAGLVDRRPAPADRRTRLVVATDAGHHVREQAARRAVAAVEGALGCLTGDERSVLRDLLGRVHAGTRAGAFAGGVESLRRD